MIFKTLIGILVGIIVTLSGLVTNILSDFNTESYWVGIGLFFGGMGIMALFVVVQKKS